MSDLWDVFDGQIKLEEIILKITENHTIKEEGLQTSYRHVDIYIEI